MPEAACSHCGTAIVDRACSVEADGKTYCCANCARAGGGPAYTPGAEGICAHCATIIVDETTLAERDGMVFCCKNCAAATAGGESWTAPSL